MRLTIGLLGLLLLAACGGGGGGTTLPGTGNPPPSNQQQPPPTAPTNVVTVSNAVGTLTVSIEHEGDLRFLSAMVSDCVQSYEGWMHFSVVVDLYDSSGSKIGRDSIIDRGTYKEGGITGKWGIKDTTNSKAESLVIVSWILAYGKT